MASPQGIRRFLRFSLRSLLLLTLVVAVWLAYEVHAARTVERQAEAIRALGGEVEFEPSPWSLLRFVEPQTYGRRIWAAQVPAVRPEEAVPLLRACPRLREVRVAFDGSTDLLGGWNLFHREFAGKRIVVVGTPVEYIEPPHWFGQDPRWNASRMKKRYQRFADKMRQSASCTEETLAEIDRCIEGDPLAGAFPDEYSTCRLADGSVAEVLVTSNFKRAVPCRRMAVLLVNDAFVDAVTFGGICGDVSFSDLDGDGDRELTLGKNESRQTDGQQLPCDSRPWLAVYSIERSGLRSLLPDDRFPHEGPTSNNQR
jgi:hypothetical protein